MLKDSKSPIQSLGVLGGATGIIVGVSQMIGYTVQPADVAEATQLISGLVTSVAGLVAMVGRIRARKRIQL